VELSACAGAMLAESSRQENNVTAGEDSLILEIQFIGE
jgi:hypothetical protein